MRVKLKTRKAASKRVGIKKNCLRRKKAYKGHLLRKKNSKQFRNLSAAAKVHLSDVASFEKMLPYR